MRLLSPHRGGSRTAPRSDGIVLWCILNDWLRTTIRGKGIYNMGEVGAAARFAPDPTLGIWSMDTPGMRVPWYYPRPWAE